MKIKQVAVDRLVPYARNARTHSEEQVSQIAASIREFGFNSPVLVDGKNGVIAGHGRILAAKLLGLGEVPVIELTHMSEEQKKLCIIDGFHRYYVSKTQDDILEANGGLVPIVVLDKQINDRMASTVRHNRARGEHSVVGMAEMVGDMTQNGWSQARICNELGMEAEEITRLQHISGVSSLFAGSKEYSRDWITTRQARLSREERKRIVQEIESKNAQAAKCSKPELKPKKRALRRSE